ncbi:MAG: gas vesicle protein GvpG [Dehalococcoidia bacterium]
MKKRSPQQQQGGGNLLVDILTLPVLGAPRMVHWVSKKLAETVEQDEMDEGRLQGQLLDLQMRYELGEIDDDEYAEQETAILDRLSVVRKAKEQE